MEETRRRLHLPETGREAGVDVSARGVAGSRRERPPGEVGGRSERDEAGEVVEEVAVCPVPTATSFVALLRFAFLVQVRALCLRALCLRACMQHSWHKIAEAGEQAARSCA